MQRGFFLRPAALALQVYGIVGLFVAVAMAMVSYATFEQVERLRLSLNAERIALTESLRAVSATTASAVIASANVETSVLTARDAADAAAGLAADSALSFRSLAQSLNFQIFGLQPFTTVTPQLETTAQQLDQLGTQLLTTGDALEQNAADVQRLSRDLALVEQQVNEVAEGFSRATNLLASPAELLPFQVALYGMCALFALQSIFSFVAGLVVQRYYRRVRQRRLAGLAAERAAHGPPPGRRFRRGP